MVRRGWPPRPCEHDFFSRVVRARVCRLAQASTREDDHQWRARLWLLLLHVGIDLARRRALAELLRDPHPRGTHKRLPRAPYDALRPLSACCIDAHDKPVEYPGGCRQTTVSSSACGVTAVLFDCSCLNVVCQNHVIRFGSRVGPPSETRHTTQNGDCTQPRPARPAPPGSRDSLWRRASRARRSRFACDSTVYSTQKRAARTTRGVASPYTGTPGTREESTVRVPVPCAQQQQHERHEQGPEQSSCARGARAVDSDCRHARRRHARRPSRLLVLRGLVEPPAGGLACGGEQHGILLMWHRPGRLPGGGVNRQCRLRPRDVERARRTCDRATPACALCSRRFHSWEAHAGTHIVLHERVESTIGVGGLRPTHQDDQCRAVAARADQRLARQPGPRVRQWRRSQVAATGSPDRPRFAPFARSGQSGEPFSPRCCCRIAPLGERGRTGRSSYTAQYGVRTRWRQVRGVRGWAESCVHQTKEQMPIAHSLFCRRDRPSVVAEMMAHLKIYFSQLDVHGVGLQLHGRVVVGAVHVVSRVAEHAPCKWTVHDPHDQHGAAMSQSGRHDQYLSCADRPNARQPPGRTHHARDDHVDHPRTSVLGTVHGTCRMYGVCRKLCTVLLVCDAPIPSTCPVHRAFKEQAYKTRTGTRKSRVYRPSAPAL